MDIARTSDTFTYTLARSTSPQNIVILVRGPLIQELPFSAIRFTPTTEGNQFTHGYGGEVYNAQVAYLYDLEDDADRAEAERISPGITIRLGGGGGGGGGAAAVPSLGSSARVEPPPLPSSGSSAMIAAAAGAAAAAVAASRYADPRAKVAAILTEYHTPMGPLKPLGEKRAGRYGRPDWVDLTDLHSTCTIDDESSEDLDDAISIEETAAGVILYVHVVDIAHEDLSRELMQRQQEYCSSMYLPGHIEHLLKDAATVRRLSLVQGVVRTAITVKIRLGAGADEPCEIFKSLIRVKARLSYTDLRTAIGGGGGAASGGAGGAASSSGSVASICLDPIVQHLLPIARLKLQPRQDIAYKVVAVAMETANAKVAAYMSTKLIAIPYLIESGRYSLEPTPHPDMGLYTHFTSPLRRYADVLVHRILAGYTAIPELEAQVAHINERMALIKRLGNEGK